MTDKSETPGKYDETGDWGRPVGQVDPTKIANPSLTAESSRQPDTADSKDE